MMLPFEMPVQPCVEGRIALKADGLVEGDWDLGTGSRDRSSRIRVPELSIDLKLIAFGIGIFVLTVKVCANREAKE